jgi:DNA sulfur modification protein DndD
MLIKELRICDFLVFAGEQRIKIPTAQESNLVVILAPNNTGKTNIIRALKFLLYGHLPDCTEATAYRLIHDGLRASARVGQELYAWVEITLELEEDELSLRRLVRTSKRGKDQWMPPEIMLTKVIHGPKIRLLADSDGVYQTKLRTLVPEQLFDAFYFKGEPMDGKLLGGVTGIRQSLASFLHEDRWADAEEAAESVRREYTRELSRVTEKNKEYNELLNNEDLFRSSMIKEQEALTTKRQHLAEVVGQFEDVTSQLQELGSGNDAERLVGQLRQLRGKCDEARKTRQRVDSEIARLVGASRGIPFLLGAIPTAKRILSELQRDNIIPADVSERFVNRVLADQSCVCGRPHDDHTRLAWTRYKEKTLSVDLNRGLSDLLSMVQDSHSHSYTKQSADIAAKLKALLESRAEALNEIEQFGAGVADLEKQLQNSPLEEIRSLTQKLRELAAARERLKGDIRQLELSVEATQRNLRALKEKMDKARPSGALAKKEQILQQARNRAEQLRLLIQQSREMLTHSFHALLQASVSQYYDSAAYDGSKARINRTTLLPAIESNGQVHGNLGGGQSQLLALAYIVSLSRMRKCLHAQMQELGIGFGRVDDQSFFLDSPFSHVTEHYAHAIAKFLDGNARQVVLLLSRQQWNLVRSIIEPAAQRLYAFEYHSIKDKIDELREKDPKLEDFTYPVNNQKIKLIEALNRTDGSPYTKIIPLS